MIDKENLNKAYDHRQVEDKLYARWTERGYFHGEVDEKKKPFTIVIPPPNITGQLHMGHALDEMIQDAIIPVSYTHLIRATERGAAHG